MHDPARMHLWAKTGVLDRLFAVLRDLHLIDGGVEVLGLDSTSVKVHPDGTGAQKKRAAEHRQIARRVVEDPHDLDR